MFELQAEVIALTVTGLFLGITVDERQRLGEELRKSLHLAAAGRMAAALAHELNQPLTAVTSYAAAARRIAADAPAPSPALAGALDRLVAEAHRAAQVVRRMRDFFRTGSVELHPTRCEEVARAVLESVRADAAAKGIDVRLEADALPLVLADALQVEIVLRNLVANAMEAVAPARRREASRSRCGTTAGASSSRRCATAARASRPRRARASSSRSRPRARAAWAWGSPSAGPSSRRTAGRSRAGTGPGAASASRCPRERTPMSERAPPFTVHVVDDDPSVRDAIALLLSLNGYVTAVFASAEDFLAAARADGAGMRDRRHPHARHGRAGAPRAR